MKKSLFFLGAILSAGILSAPAYAADSFYVSGNVGVSSFSEIKPQNSVTGVQEGIISTKSGIDLTGAFGRSFGTFRLEGEVGYQKNSSDKILISQLGRTFPLTGDFSVTSYMLNGYYDIPVGVVTPYLSTGIGLAEVRLDNVLDPPPPAISETHSALGYQFGAGVAVPVTKNISFDARYRYSRTTQITLSGNHGKLDVSGSGFLVGVRVGL